MASLIRGISFSKSELGRIRSVGDYVDSCLALVTKNQSAKIVFRGQPRGSDKLRPSIGRRWEYAGRWKSFDAEDEANLIHRFRRRVYPLEGALTPLEALFVARDYGLPTRLLDWTANALYALYFASTSRFGEDGAVWAIRQHDDDSKQSALNPFQLASLDSEEELLGVLARDQVKIIYPIFNSPRIVAQDGLFTLHAKPHKPLEEYQERQFPEGDIDIHSLYRWHIQADRKPRIVHELNGLGITDRIVYPDREGIARSLWETEVLWNGQKLANRAKRRSKRHRS